MADDPRPVAKPEAFWGAVQLAARIHASTAETWQAIRGAAAEYNVQLPPNMFTEVNRLRSAAVALRNASEQLGRASRSDAITSDMLAPQLYARSAQEQSLAPAWHVRFELQTVRGSDVSSEWYVMGYQGLFPATIGELMDDLEAYSAGLGEAYGVAVSGITTVEIGSY